MRPPRAPRPRGMDHSGFPLTAPELLCHPRVGRNRLSGHPPPASTAISAARRGSGRIRRVPGRPAAGPSGRRRRPSRRAADGAPLAVHARPRDPRPGLALAARLRDRPEGEAARAVALLTARHWRSMHDYAAVCLASSGQTAAMATAAALHRVLDRIALGEPAVALRPVLLVAVRDTVREWA